MNRWASLAQDAKTLAATISRLYQMSSEDRAMLGAIGRRYFKAYFDHDKPADDLMAFLRAMSKTIEEAV